MTKRMTMVICSLLSIFGWQGCSSNEAAMDNCVQVMQGAIEFPAVIYPQRYNEHRDRAQGHHGIVWQGGGAAHKALIEAQCADRDILAALEQAGAEPGNNLTQETWSARNDPDSPEPDQQVEGTAVRVTVQWDEVEKPWHALFREAGEEDFVIRVGGHAELIPVWRSGCVTCLFSCPGGRTSNAAYTIRDQAQQEMAFYADEETLPADGTAVTVRMALVAGEEGSGG